ncbi:MAG TPA: sn-glycerol-3-phosphate ABC transporter ATP-binding protein UgpC [Solirubrobacteraceae bacterium]|nr:sn-glycerol-3-phosphate ABC transporter ATP-binding protein UgpC [Solirubrobacteraceae bacterium]
MATIDIDGVSKVYPGSESQAVSELDLHVADGEFLILVGPSGCGKTTALRMIAGLEEITEGEIRIGERVVNDLSPSERDVAMVFQNYALYPHMTVAENIGFALSLQKADKQEIRRRVGEAAEVLGLSEHLRRKPAQLSGGQRQRVAMGRAIVREPAAFLMDEPLSNLDAKLRVQMRTEVSRVQKRLGVATVYVTHDQIEAMTMGDRVAVMRSGRLQQCDSPQVLYDAPVNLFVAAFIGSPAMNLYQAEVDAEGTRLILGEQALELPSRLRSAIARWRGKDIVVGIRPEDLSDAALSEREDAAARLEGAVDLVESLGAEKLVHFHIDASRLQSSDERLSTDEDLDLSAGEIGQAASTAGVARVPPASRIEVSQRAVFLVAVDRVHLFDPDSGTAIDAGTREGISERAA